MERKKEELRVWHKAEKLRIDNGQQGRWVTEGQQEHTHAHTRHSLTSMSDRAPCKLQHPTAISMMSSEDEEDRDATQEVIGGKGLTQTEHCS